MNNFDLWRTPNKKASRQFDLSIALGSNQKKETKRDTRRAFSQTQRKEILYQQNNRCAGAECHKNLDPRDIEFDHKKPWSSGGRTITVNGRALCASCHKIITHKTKLREIDKKRKIKKKNNTLEDVIGGNLKGLSQNLPKNNLWRVL